MPNKSSGLSSISLREFIKDPKQTYFIITALVTLIAILHIIPQPAQQSLANFFRANSWLVAIVLVIVLGLTYFNWIAGLMVLLLLICVMFPLRVCPPPTQITKEGFKSDSQKNDSGDETISMNNKHIKSLFTGGYLGKKVEEYREVRKNLISEENAREKSMQIMNTHRNDDKAGTKSDVESFSETSGNNKKKRLQENFREIEMRKFDPTNEEDMNLLMTMDHCSDIQNRIKFKYEDNKYLKKYIREKLEDIVDLLDLVPTDE